MSLFIYEQYLQGVNIYSLSFLPLPCGPPFISGPKYRWAMKIGQWPTSLSFACKNRNFDGPFDILMGLLEKNDGPKIP